MNVYIIKLLVVIISVLMLAFAFQENITIPKEHDFISHVESAGYWNQWYYWHRWRAVEKYTHDQPHNDQHHVSV